jgi:hypothetical protein
MATVHELRPNSADTEKITINLGRMNGEAEGAARGNPAPTIAIMAMLIATASSNGVGP